MSVASASCCSFGAAPRLVSSPPSSSRSPASACPGLARGSSFPSSAFTAPPSSWLLRSLRACSCKQPSLSSPRWNTHGLPSGSGFWFRSWQRLSPTSSRRLLRIVDGSYGGDSLACSTSVSRYWRSAESCWQELLPGSPGGPGEGADAASLATVRTAVLAASALALGALGPLERFREASWLVYPLLVAGGIKLAVEDFPQGRAATLFVGLALYGGALILAPRAMRSAKGRPSRSRCADLFRIGARMLVMDAESGSTVRLRERLTVRLTAGVILTLLVIGVPFLLAFHGLWRDQHLEVLAEARAGMSRVLVDSLRSAMLAGGAPPLRHAHR